jgi:two-component system NtrC family sensor kinase
LQTLIDTIPSPVFYKDTNGVYQGCNLAFETYLGLSKAEIIGRTVYELAPKDLADKYYEMDSALFSQPGVQVYEGSVQYADGTIHEVIFHKATFSKLGDTLGGLVGVMLDITERKQVEEELVQSKAQLEAIFNSMADGVIFADTQRRVVSINHAAEELWGYTLEELRGKTTERLYDEKDGYEEQGRRRYHLGSEVERQTFEIRYRRKDGTVFLGETRGSRVRDAQGKGIGFIGIHRNITDQKRAQEEREKLSRFPSENPQPVLRVARGGAILYANDAASPLLSLWGCQVNQILPDYWCEFTLDALNSGSSKDTEVECGNRVFSLEFAPVVDADYVNLYGIDITGRKQAEEELQKAHDQLELRVEKRTAELIQANEQLQREIEERALAVEKIWKARAMLRSVVDGISEPLLVLDTNLSVRMLNKAALKYYQLAAYQDAMGKPCTEVFKGESDSCARCPVPSVLSDGRNATYDRKGHSDPNRLEQVTVYPLQEASGEVTGCILRITDITEEKEVERQLIRADRLSSLGQLSGGIAHEIRNPLAGINLFVDVLCDEDKFERTDNELEIFEEIKNNINRIDGIIRGILDFSKDSDAVSAEIDLNSLIEEILKLWHAKMRNQEIRLQLSLEEDLPTFFGDPIAIQQVVNNLVHNAVEAMAEGGLLQISTQKGVASFNKDRPIAKIQIQDTGPGIAPDQQEKIFNPFFTTKHTGTGLGLSISHQIIERHGGIISLESKPDELTTFKIELPTTPKS